MERDTFMTAEDAKLFGLIDDVVTKRPLPEKMFKFSRFDKGASKRLVVSTNFVCNKIN